VHCLQFLILCRVHCLQFLIRYTVHCLHFLIQYTVHCLHFSLNCVWNSSLSTFLSLFFQLRILCYKMKFAECSVCIGTLHHKPAVSCTFLWSQATLYCLYSTYLLSIAHYNSSTQPSTHYCIENSVFITCLLMWYYWWLSELPVCEATVIPYWYLDNRVAHVT